MSAIATETDGRYIRPIDVSAGVEALRFARTTVDALAMAREMSVVVLGLVAERLGCAAVAETVVRSARGPRQFCRTGIHSSVPAVTLSFDNGSRLLHWCDRHAADAEQYRANAD